MYSFPIRVFKFCSSKTNHLWVAGVAADWQLSKRWTNSHDFALDSLHYFSLPTYQCDCLFFWHSRLVLLHMYKRWRFGIRPLQIVDYFDVPVAINVKLGQTGCFSNIERGWNWRKRNGTKQYYVVFTVPNRFVDYCCCLSYRQSMNTNSRFDNTKSLFKHKVFLFN